jgi:hypothetical protein
MRRLLLLAGALSLLACNAEGRLRFSTVVGYEDSQGFDSPLAVGRLVIVGLEDQATSEPLGALTLSVSPRDGGEARVFPLGLATFGVIVSAPGGYDLVAEDAAGEVERLSVTAEEVASLKLASSAELGTFQNQGSNRECASFETLARFDPADFVLHQNQQIQVSVVPLNAAGEPLIGLLSLAAAGPDSLLLTGGEARQGASANSVRVEAVGLLGDAAAITFSEAGGAAFVINLNTSAELDPRGCE